MPKVCRRKVEGTLGVTRVDSEAQLDLYQLMLRIRVVEEALIEEYHPLDQMRCPIHFCIGQEAAPAALGLVLQPDDVVSSHYRSHGYYLAKGAPLDAMVAEFYGKASGSNGGVGGSMELAHHDSKIYSGAIVGGTAGLAVGSAFAQKYRRSSDVTVAVFGDGAMDEGIAYEAINLAVLRQLPVLFLCENNGYAAHAPIANRSRAHSLAARAAAFGIEAERIEDRNPEALLARLADIVAAMRVDRRPFFLEVETYRFCGHVGPEGDDEMGYRPADEIQARQAADPLKALHDRLAAISGASLLATVKHKAVVEIAAAIDAAKRAAFPSRGWARSIVAAGTYDPLITEFVEGAVSEFRGAQMEAKLAPY